MKTIMKTATIIISMILIAMLTACGTNADSKPVVSKDVNDVTNVMSKLNEAETITVNKKIMTYNDQWTVKADGSEIAHIEGKVLPVWGDTYVMYSNKDNLIASEAENKQWAGHGATIYDYNNEQTGHIKDELFSWGYKFHVIDNDGHDVAITESKPFNLTLTFDIKDNHDNIMYSVKKSMFSWGSELTITKKTSDTGNVSGLDAIWLTTIINEINENDNSKASRKTSTSSANSVA